MKSVKIEVPQGYEIDKEKSTFENIVFKEVKNELPKSWEKLKVIKGYYVTSFSNICDVDSTTEVSMKSTFAKKEQAEASLALAQLSQLREVYRNGWKPDWKDGDYKYCIYFGNDLLTKCSNYETSMFLSFQDEETRDLFLENFRDLIEQAKPLLS